MGTVLAQILASNNINVALLGRRSEQVDALITHRENKRYLPGLHLAERVVPTVDAAAAFHSSEVIISATPCQFLRASWKRYAQEVPAGIPICSVTKGVEVETLARPTQILAEEVPGRPVAVLSGPSVAPEIARFLPATVVVCALEVSIAELFRDALTTSAFRVYTNDDILGVELAGALKNVIAIAAGILDGLKAGDNAKASLLTRGLVEIARLGVACGARQETFYGLAGVGDLVTTCVSPIGRNRTAGERIGRGSSADEVIGASESVIEGIPTTDAVLRMAEAAGVEMPITRAVHSILFRGKSPLEAVTDLMNRPPKPERLNDV